MTCFLANDSNFWIIKAMVGEKIAEVGFVDAFTLNENVWQCQLLKLAHNKTESFFRIICHQILIGHNYPSSQIISGNFKWLNFCNILWLNKNIFFIFNVVNFYFWLPAAFFPEFPCDEDGDLVAVDGDAINIIIYLWWKEIAEYVKIMKCRMIFVFFYKNIVHSCLI